MATAVILVEGREKVYWEVQFHMVILLKKAGIYHQVNRRIEPFKLKIALDKAGIEPGLKFDIDQALEEMVRLRISGLEPKHERGFYK